MGVGIDETREKSLTWKIYSLAGECEFVWFFNSLNNSPVIANEQANTRPELSFFAVKEFRSIESRHSPYSISCQIAVLTRKH